MEAEDANFSLFNYVNEVNAEVEKLEDQIGDIKVGPHHSSIWRSTVAVRTRSEMSSGLVFVLCAVLVFSVFRSGSGFGRVATISHLIG